MTTTIHWDDAFPMLRLEGKGARDFLQGQTTADLSGLVDGELQQSCWLTVRLTFVPASQDQVVTQLKLFEFGIELSVLCGEQLLWILSLGRTLQDQKIVIGCPYSTVACDHQPTAIQGPKVNAINQFDLLAIAD